MDQLNKYAAGSTKRHAYTHFRTDHPMQQTRQERPARLDGLFREIFREMVERLGDDPSHSIDHSLRVLKNALKIARESRRRVNFDVIRFAALLHDLARRQEDSDDSGETDHAILGAEIASQILSKHHLQSDFIENVTHCIRTHRFRSNHRPKTLEAQILYDADKLDLLGTVGIARSYMIAGSHNQKIFVFSSDDYQSNNTQEERIKCLHKHAPNLEWDVKISKIPARLLTEPGRKMAAKKYEYMKEFFTLLKSDCNLQDLRVLSYDIWLKDEGLL